MVIKRGSKTGVTIGRANELRSFTRHIWENKEFKHMEWSILSRDSKSGAFSARGDSGAAIVDAKGRLGGIRIGGSHYSETYDVTPIEPLLQSFEDHGFSKANLNPELSA